MDTSDDMVFSMDKEVKEEVLEEEATTTVKEVVVTPPPPTDAPAQAMHGMPLDRPEVAFLPPPPPPPLRGLPGEPDVMDVDTPTTNVRTDEPRVTM